MASVEVKDELNVVNRGAVILSSTLKHAPNHSSELYRSCSRLSLRTGTILRRLPLVPLVQSWSVFRSVKWLRCRMENKRTFLAMPFNVSAFVSDPRASHISVSTPPGDTRLTLMGARSRAKLRVWWRVCQYFYLPGLALCGLGEALTIPDKAAR